MNHNEKTKQEVLKIYDYVKREEVSVSHALRLMHDLAEEVYLFVNEPYFDAPEDEHSTIVCVLCELYEDYQTAKKYLKAVGDEREGRVELRDLVSIARTGKGIPYDSE